MIKSISEVQSMLLTKGELIKNPTFKSAYMMTSPGCSSERIIALKENIINFPQLYLDIISQYSFEKVEIDGFYMSPYSFKSSDTIAGLLEAYEDPFFPKEFMRKHKMYQIGSYNTDILCVTEGTDQFRAGEILYIDEGYNIYNPEDSQIHPIAKNFEQFIIIAGNLEQIHSEITEDESNYEEKKKEFVSRLRALEVDEKYDSAWLNVF